MSKSKCDLTWWVMLLVVLALAYYLGGRLQPGQERYTIFDPDLYEPGTIQRHSLPLAKGGGMFIVNDHGTFYAIIAEDPYDKCSVSWSKIEQVFYSPCSDHRYNIDGSYQSGSSPGGLDRYQTFMQYGNIVVDTETRIKGEPKPASVTESRNEVTQ